MAYAGSSNLPSLGGSNPLACTHLDLISLDDYFEISFAQVAERHTHLFQEQGSVGSNPTLGTWGSDGPRGNNDIDG